MMSLNYCLSRSDCGDSAAAYEAALIMHLEKHNELMVQAQLKKAALLGSVDAMRWLGFLALSGKLISPDSTLTSISYLTAYDHAYNWFMQAFKRGDALSAFLVGTCLQYGIGTPQDTKRAAEIISEASGHIPISDSIASTAPINALKNLATTA